VDVGGVGGAEEGEVGWGGPLVGGEEVVVEGGGGEGEGVGVGGREVQLFALVGKVGGGFGGGEGVPWGGGGLVWNDDGCCGEGWGMRSF